MKDYLKGKSVAIVGPALSIEGSGNGELIDSHDVVVRINYPKLSDPKDGGTKTNIIYYDGSLHNYDSLDLEYLICSYPRTEWFFNERCLKAVEHFSTKYNHHIINADIYNQLKVELNKNKKVRPNSGLIAIVDLLRYDIKSLFITGLDFYRSRYVGKHPDYGHFNLIDIGRIFKAGDNGETHDIERQFEYFKYHVSTDPRLEVDNFLKNFI